MPVPSFLVTFTLPEALWPVARSHQSLISNLLLQTSSAAWKALALDPQYLGGQIGLVGVLHTWTRELAYHPPIHYLVPGGALAPDGSQWLSPSSAEWLVPVHALATLFRGKCKAALTTTGLLTSVAPQVWHKGWVTHGQPAGTGTAVLASFAPSLHRIALTTNRLETCEDGHVTFRVKERTSRAWTHRRLPAEEFMRRFLQHVLPKGCIKVRYYGLLSPSRRPALAQSQALLTACLSPTQAAKSGDNREQYETPPTPTAALHCPTCGGQLVFLCRLVPQKSRPPSCRSAVTDLMRGRPSREGARQGVYDPTGTA